VFFFTGWAVVIISTRPASSPRKRLCLPGSFYVFAIWIGLGVISANSFFERLQKRWQPGRPSAPSA